MNFFKSSSFKKSSFIILILILRNYVKFLLKLHDRKNSQEILKVFLFRLRKVFEIRKWDSTENQLVSRAKTAVSYYDLKTKIKRQVASFKNCLSFFFFNGCLFLVLFIFIISFPFVSQLFFRCCPSAFGKISAFRRGPFAAWPFRLEQWTDCHSNELVGFCRCSLTLPHERNFQLEFRPENQRS